MLSPSVEGFECLTHKGVPRREQQEKVAHVGLLSAEHTEFTWNQKTWEDKLIQVRT